MRRPFTLTRRQKQVTAMVGMGKTNQQIADELHLLPGTIKMYMHEIFGKLGIRSRLELGIWAATHKEVN